jgi:hypothetical protein
MRNHRPWISCVCCVSVLAFALQPAVVCAEPVSKIEPPQKAEFVAYDVKLDDKGTFAGKVTDASGAALKRAPVVLYQGRKQIAKTRTDKLGRFTFAGLRGGSYQLYTVGRQGMITAWTPSAAPPHASESLLVVTDHRVVRGQYDLNSVLSSGVIPIVVVSAAAIAIPIIVSDSKDRKSSS